MTMIQEILLLSGIVVAVVAVIILAVYMLVGRGLGFRIYLYVTPVNGIIGIMGFILGKIGLRLNSAPLIIGSAAGLAVVILLLLYRATVSTMHEHTQSLQSSSAELAATSKQAAATAVQQATMVSQVSTTVEEILQTSTAASASANEVMSVASEAAEQSRRGRLAAAEAMRIMDIIGKTNTIVETVNELAEQSNLLAVNASIEAAKAGEYGRGFTVVASEVRNLAEQSKAATRQIREAIQRTDEGRVAIQSVAALIDNLSTVLEEATDKAQRIAAATVQQSTGIRQITEAMSSLAQGGQETAAAAKQIEDAASRLQEMGGQLREFVGGR